MWIAAAAIAAPVDPADTKPSALPSSTSFAATLIDAPGFSRRARRGLPHPDHLRGVDDGKTGAVPGELGFDDLGDPDENHVDTASCGVNRANGLLGGVVAPHGVEGDSGQGSGSLDHLAAAVRSALTTGAMGQLGLAALLAGHRAGAGHFPR